MISRPMLACATSLTKEDTEQLHYPVYVSDKEDGIRVLQACKDGELRLFSRKLKQIPNNILGAWAEWEAIAGLDGEIVIPGATFHEIQSWVMSEITFPRAFEYRVFDHWTTDRSKTYLQRLQIAERKLDRYAPKNTAMLPVKEIKCAKDLWYWFNYRVTDAKKEGLIVRSPDGPYKQGRSTMREQYMLKMKHYEEGEAIVIGFEPEYENQNEQTRDETGAAKRSSHQANRIAKPRLGAFLCEDCETKEEFRIGSGMDHSFKTLVWENRPHYLRATVTYKWQVHGTKDKPRTPIFKGIRLD